MNWMNSKIWTLFALLSLAMGCSDCGNEPEPEPGELRFVADRSVLENPFNSTLTFEVRLVSATTQEVTVDYETVPGSATAGEDFQMTSGTLVFAPGDLKKEINVSIVVDESLESDEQFTVELSNPTNAFLTGNQQIATGTIVNDDTQLNVVLPEGGYDTPHSPDNPPAGMTLAWSDEFDQESIDSGNWIHELGGGGWGNQEAQSYTASESNSFLQDDHLFIVALEDGDSYTSARLKSQDLQEFTHGRIDVRAVLPFGQALWPAIWMLGANFTDAGVGWPAADSWSARDRFLSCALIVIDNSQMPCTVSVLGSFIVFCSVFKFRQIIIWSTNIYNYIYSPIPNTCGMYTEQARDR